MISSRVVWFSRYYPHLSWRDMSFEDARAWLLWDLFVKGKYAG